MKSMTGFGLARGRVEGRSILIEARSVNHRYCEVNLRFPSRYASLEPEIAKLVRRRFDRGKFDLFLREDSARDGEGELLLAQRSFGLLKKIKKRLKLPGPITLSDLVTFYGLERSRSERHDSERGKKVCLQLSHQALTGLEKMRRSEGSHLQRWFRGRLRRMRRVLVSIERGAKKARTLAAEEGSEVTEEIVRLRSHLHQFERFSQSPEPIGRKLDFLSQEMLRELNTIGAKVQGARLTHQVVDLKSEMEKIREQVQNIE